MRVISNLASIIKDDIFGYQTNQTIENLVEQFIAAFMNKSMNNQYLSGIQTSYVLAIYSHIYDGVNISLDGLKQGLIDRVTKVDNSMITTGILGNKFLYQVLDDSLGETASELAIGMIKGWNNKTKTFGNYPSYVYMSNNTLEPATTVWELWDAPNEGDSMNSRAHHMYSTVSAYLVKNLGGIKIKTKGLSGYKYWIDIGGVNQNTLEWANVKMDEISYQWKWKCTWNWKFDKQFEFILYVPIHEKVGIVFDKMFNKCNQEIAKKKCEKLWIVDVGNANDVKWQVNQVNIEYNTAAWLRLMKKCLSFIVQRLVVLGILLLDLDSTIGMCNVIVMHNV